MQVILPSSADMEFCLAPCQAMDRATEQDVEAFLSLAETAHPLQFPSWGVGDLRDVPSNHWYFVGRQDGSITIFGRGTLVPLFTRAVPRLRGLSVFRGPALRSGVDARPWLRRLVEAARLRGLVFLDISPDWIDGRSAALVDQLKDDGWAVVSDGPPRMTLRVDLAPTEFQLFGALEVRTRNLVRRAAKENVTVRAAQTEKDLQAFLAVYLSTARRKGFESTDRAVFDALFADLRSGKRTGVILLARHGEKVLGGAIVVCAGGRAEYMYGGNSRDAVGSAGFKSYGYVLQWEAIRWAKSVGCSTYDLGGYSDSPDATNARFKRRFCESVVRFVPAHRLVLRPTAYKFYELRLRLGRLK